MTSRGLYLKYSLCCKETGLFVCRGGVLMRRHAHVALAITLSVYLECTCLPFLLPTPLCLQGFGIWQFIAKVDAFLS